jgi:8-oxo-dGTP pyrophosphatase MutT (NUDIX family)
MSFTEPTNAPSMLADDLPARLAEALRTGRRGTLAQRKMPPQMSYGRHAGPAPASARPAAVMLLLFRRSAGWHLPLTQRPATLSRHGGQISLPGGAVEPGETSSDAALRELAEELGIEESVELLGRLADCYVFASDFVITPWVAATTIEPQWRPHDREVQAVVELRLDRLLDESSITRTTIERGPLVFGAPCIQVGSACIWGATSVILGELAEVLRDCQSLVVSR